MLHTTGRGTTRLGRIPHGEHLLLGVVERLLVVRGVLVLVGHTVGRRVVRVVARGVHARYVLLLLLGSGLLHALGQALLCLDLRVCPLTLSTLTLDTTSVVTGVYGGVRDAAGTRRFPLRNAGRGLLNRSLHLGSASLLLSSRRAVCSVVITVFGSLDTTGQNGSCSSCAQGTAGVWGAHGRLLLWLLLLYLALLLLLLLLLVRRGALSLRSLSDLDRALCLRAGNGLLGALASLALGRDLLVLLLSERGSVGEVRLARGSALQGIGRFVTSGSGHGVARHTSHHRLHREGTGGHLLEVVREHLSSRGARSTHDVTLVACVTRSREVAVLLLLGLLLLLRGVSLCSRRSLPLRCLGGGEALAC